MPRTRTPAGPEFNGSAAVMQYLAFPDDVFLVDSTIRSLQSSSSGSRHTLDDLVDIGMAVDRVGVRELIVNVTWRDGLEVIERLKSQGVQHAVIATFGAGRRNWRELVADAARAGADQICYESADSDDALREAAAFAHELGLAVSHGFAEDHTYDEVISLCRTALEVGCRSVSFHDSYFRFAIAPETMKAFVRSILRDVPNAPPIYVHLSNFFGHATMTAVAALSAGASAVDVCANATGHHCGHTSLPEVALVLKYLYGVDAGIALERLRDLTVLLEQRTGVPTPPMRPIVGEYAFSGDGATWAAGAQLPSGKRLHSTFPIAPEVVGAQERVIWTDRTLTPHAIAARLSALQIEPSPDVLRRLTAHLRQTLAVRTYPCWLSDEEFGEILQTVAGAKPKFSS